MGDLSQKYTISYAEKMNLSRVKPCSSLSTTSYSLADPGCEYLVYQPDSESFSVDLSDSHGILELEWFNPVTGDKVRNGTIAGGKESIFTSDFSPAVLYIRAVDIVKKG